MHKRSSYDVEAKASAQTRAAAAASASAAEAWAAEAAGAAAEKQELIQILRENELTEDQVESFEECFSEITSENVTKLIDALRKYDFDDIIARCAENNDELDYMAGDPYEIFLSNFDEYNHANAKYYVETYEIDIDGMLGELDETQQQELKHLLQMDNDYYDGTGDSGDDSGGPSAGATSSSSALSGPTSAAGDAAAAAQAVAAPIVPDDEDGSTPIFGAGAPEADDAPSS